MAITAMGIGTKTAPADVNLDPQSQFWSFLTAFVSGAGTDSDHSARAYFSGFRVRQNDPVGMSVLVGGEDGTIDSAAFKQSNTGAIVLLSTDGTPQEVTIATAPASGSRIDAIVSYIDKTSADASKETAGTPQYVKTIAVQGTAASNPSAPTNDEIAAALPTGVGGFYRWADVKVGQGVINITDDNVSDAKPASPNVYLTNQVNQNKNDIAANTKLINDKTATEHTSVNITYGISIHLHKQGKMVSLFFNSPVSRDFPATGTSGGSLPVGWRPIEEVRFYGGQDNTPANSRTFTLQTDGKMVWYGQNVVPEGSYISASVAYLTP